MKNEICLICLMINALASQCSAFPDLHRQQGDITVKVI